VSQQVSADVPSESTR